MLGDVKSFFTKSSVGEVGVGLSIGAAFTNVMTEATEMGRGLLSGDLDYAGLVQALIALLAAAFFSVVLVVKPLAKLKAIADRTQVDLVARAAGDEATLTAPLAEEGLDDGLVADTSADPTVDHAAEAEPPDPRVADAAVAGLPESGDAGDAGGAGGGEAASSSDRQGDAGADGSAIDRLDPMWGAAPPVDPSSGEPGIAVDDLPVASAPLTAPEPVSASAGGPAGAGAVAPAGSEQGAGAPGVPAPTVEQPTVLKAATPHSHQVTKVCPYCAFDIPAVASRCGYCTADLTDSQRVAGVVLVDQAPPSSPSIG